MKVFLIEIRTSADFGLRAKATLIARCLYAGRLRGDRSDDP